MAIEGPRYLVLETMLGKPIRRPIAGIFEVEGGTGTCAMLVPLLVPIRQHIVGDLLSHAVFRRQLIIPHGLLESLRVHNLEQPSGVTHLNLFLMVQDVSLMQKVFLTKQTWRVFLRPFFRGFVKQGLSLG